MFLSRFTAHVESSLNFNRFQSAYRRGFSTETAILRLLSDVRCAVDEKCRSMVVLLDLSAAFDTIDIEILLRRLEHTFGITGSALLWLQTYLEGRSQYVRIGDNQSTILPCEFGVPQGSVLGPKLFAAYIAPIAGVISSFGIHHAQYADDTQLYIELRDDNTLLTLSSCFRAVHGWFSENGLELNPDKSEVIVIGTGARNRREGEIVMTTLGDTQIPVSKTVKSLGVTLDDKLSFNTHVDNVCKASHFHIRALRHIRGCIDEETACMGQVRWSDPVSTTVTPFSMEHPQRTSGNCSGSSTRSHGWFLGQGEAIILPRFWPDCTGSPSRHGLHSRSHSWPSRRSRRKNRNISPRCSTSKPRQGHFDRPRETVCMWRLSELFSPVMLSAMPHPQSGTISRLTWLTCL